MCLALAVLGPRQRQSAQATSTGFTQEDPIELDETAGSLFWQPALRAKSPAL